MSFRLVVVVLWIVERDSRDGVDFCAEKSEEVDLALRLRIWHVDHELVAFGTADVCEANTGVSCGLCVIKSVTIPIRTVVENSDIPLQ